MRLSNPAIKFVLIQQYSLDTPGRLSRTREPGESPTPSVLRATCREQRSFYLIAMETCREEKLQQRVVWHTSLQRKRNVLKLAHSNDSYRRELPPYCSLCCIQANPCRHFLPNFTYAYHYLMKLITENPCILKEQNNFSYL